MKPLVIVSGKNGQLGWELERLSSQFAQYEFIFFDRNGLDIANEEQVVDLFEKYKPSVFINCAAYTAVDKAEKEQAAAYKANAAGVGFLAIQCRIHQTLFISFSTDYVFNGEGSAPYHEDDATDPVNYYGYTKEAGEQQALKNWEKTIIIRTSWVYSMHGNNFVKTMLRLMKERTDINVVQDQIGSPTYAKDLAQAVMKLLVLSSNQPPVYGIYHFSNEGVISWFDFAKAIKELANLPCHVHPIPSSAYPTPAKRPHYSVLSKEKIQMTGIGLRDWKESLQECLAEMQEFK